MNNQKYYILVVDDVKFNRIGMINILHLIYNFIIIEAENGLEAFETYVNQ